MAGGAPQTATIAVNSKEKINYSVPMALMVTLFFVFGIITVLNDILIPHFKSTFHLTDLKSTLVQFAFFFAYFVMAMPSSYVISKVGYKKSIVIGLMVVSAGCIGFYPAAELLSYPMFLVALFIIASGITLLQVAANAYVTVLGDPNKASARISLCGGLNSTATVIGPIIAASLILNTHYFNEFESNAQKETNVVEKLEAAEKVVFTHLSQEELKELQQEGPTFNKIPILKDGLSNEEAEKTKLAIETAQIHNRIEVLYFAYQKLKESDKLSTVQKEQIKSVSEPVVAAKKEVDELVKPEKADAVPMPYLFLAGFVFMVSLVFSFVKLPKILGSDEKGKKEKSQYSALSFRHLKLGIVAIFLYVGAEVVVGSFLIKFIGLDNILGLQEQEAANYVSLYWGAALVARLIGFVALQYVNPTKALLFVSALAAVLVSVSMVTDGWLSLVCMMGLGFCHSVMWPIIFAVALRGLGKYKTQGSGLLIMGVVGGALVPLIQGGLMDSGMSVQSSFIVTLLCYIFLIYYAVGGYRNVNISASIEAGDQEFAKETPEKALA